MTLEHIEQRLIFKWQNILTTYFIIFVDFTFKKVNDFADKSQWIAKCVFHEISKEDLHNNI